MERRQHRRDPSDGHEGCVPKCGEREADPCNEGHADRWRPHTMDRKLSLREDGGDGIRRERLAESLRGSRCTTGITRVADSLREIHRWAYKLG